MEIDSLEDLKENVENGNSSKKLLLSYRYQYGIGEIGIDLKESKKWLDKSAMNGNLIAKLRKLAFGWGIQKDEKLAHDLLEEYLNCEIEKTKEEEMIAFNMMGYLCSNNPSKAIDYFSKSIEKGNPIALFNLALIYHKNKELKDIKKAKQFYKLSIKNGLKMALNNLATIYESIDSNPEKARRFYEKATNSENINSFYNLAILYDNGNKIERNLEAAAFCYYKILDTNLFERQRFFIIISTKEIQWR